MAFARPTLAQLVARVVGDAQTGLELLGAPLRRTMVRVLSAVVAGASHMLHGHIDWAVRQAFVDLADDEYLVRLAALHGLAKTPPGFARATATFNGDGSTLPAGSILVRGDGVEYETTADVDTIDGTPVDGEVLAVVAGAAGTLPVGAALQLQSPVAGIDSTATVSVSLEDGTDTEDPEAFRTRVLEYLRTPSRGGNEVDYITWAKEVPGVTRVWLWPRGLAGELPGQLILRFVRDGDPDPLPDPGEVTAVQDHIDQPDRRPVVDTCLVLGLTPLVVNFQVTITPDTSQNRTAVEAALRARLHPRRLRPGYAPAHSSMEASISPDAIESLTDSEIVSPPGNVTVEQHEFLQVGTVTFV